MCLLVSLRKARNVSSIRIQSCVTCFTFHGSVTFLSPSVCAGVGVGGVSFRLHVRAVGEKQNEQRVTSIIHGLILGLVKRDSRVALSNFSPHKQRPEMEQIATGALVLLICLCS